MPSRTRTGTAAALAAAVVVLGSFGLTGVASADECPPNVSLNAICEEPKPSPTPTPSSTRTKNPDPKPSPSPTRTRTRDPKPSPSASATRSSQNTPSPSNTPAASPSPTSQPSKSRLPMPPSEYPTAWPSEWPTDLPGEERPDLSVYPQAAAGAVAAPPAAGDQSFAIKIVMLLFAAGTIAFVLIRARVRRWMIGI